MPIPVGHLSMDLRTFTEAVDSGIAQRRNLEACYAEALAQQKAALASSDPNAGPAKFVEDLPVDDQRWVIEKCFFQRNDTVDEVRPFDTPGLAGLTSHVDKGVYIDQVRRWFNIL